MIRILPAARIRSHSRSGRSKAAPGSEYRLTSTPTLPAGALMNPEDIALLQKAASGLEGSLVVLETWLENANGRSIYLASLSVALAMRHLHDAEPQLLSVAGRQRVEAVLLEEKRTVKKDRFQTGF